MKLIFSLLLLTFFHLQGEGDFLYVGRFLYINNISRTYNHLTVSTPDGFFVYDINLRKIIISYPVKEGVKLAVFSGDRVFLVTGQNRFTVYDHFLRTLDAYDYISDPRSLGTNGETVAIQSGDRWKFYTSSGFPLNEPVDTSGFFWCGEKVNLKEEDPALIFLTPMKKYNPSIGEVDYTVFYPWMNFLYAGTRGDGIFVFDLNSKTLLDSIKIGFFRDSLIKIIPGEEKIWFLGREFVALLDGEIFTNFIPYSTPFFNISDFVDGTPYLDKLILLNSNARLAIFNDGEWNTGKDIPGIEYALHIYSLEEHLFIAGENCLVKYKPSGKASEFDIEDIRGISALHDYLILNQSQRLLLIRNDSIFTFEDSLEYLTRGLSLISQYNRDEVACLSAGGITILNSALNYNYVLPAFSPLSATSIATESQKIAVGTENGEIWVYNGKNELWERYTLPLLSPVISIYFYKPDIIFALTSSGLFVVKIR